MSPDPCEVADAGSKTEVKAETEEVHDGECARPRLYRRMEEKTKTKSSSSHFQRTSGRKWIAEEVSCQCVTRSRHRVR